ncbi:hypothetical protein AYI70_g11087 [Smittium culicis]|uniref:Uncharacterized protein n=1 Tax=Smittium culicis TaxID=133412 RepID=A0A1R1X3G2_9FUNG|nr:hypothetical protein AYI70_g11087 [Smittium culicis]
MRVTDYNSGYPDVEIRNSLPFFNRFIGISTNTTSSINSGFRNQKRKIFAIQEQKLKLYDMYYQLRFLKEQGLSDLAI